jgi:Chitobiase/beta-hexosaminidase C-terminal domain
VESGCNGGFVDPSHVVHLACDTHNAQILYTTDGSTPMLHLPHTKVFCYYNYRLTIIDVSARFR